MYLEKIYLDRYFVPRNIDKAIQYFKGHYVKISQKQWSI